jgi:hypothetical protein
MTIPFSEKSIGKKAHTFSKEKRHSVGEVNRLVVAHLIPLDF